MLLNVRFDIPNQLLPFLHNSVIDLRRSLSRSVWTSIVTVWGDCCRGSLPFFRWGLRAGVRLMGVHWSKINIAWIFMLTVVWSRCLTFLLRVLTIFARITWQETRTICELMRSTYLNCHWYTRIIRKSSLRATLSWTFNLVRFVLRSRCRVPVMTILKWW